MNIDDIKAYYTNIINQELELLSRIKKLIFQIGTLRLIVAIVCFVGVYLFWGNTPEVLITLFASVVVFLVLMKYHAKHFKIKRYKEQKVINAQNELNALDYDFSAFDSGFEFINADHSFSIDLDLFGNRSFFQSINRTATSFGKVALANHLIHPLKKSQTIVDRQNAIEELSRKDKLLIHYQAIGQLMEIDNLNTSKFADSFSIPALLLNSKMWNTLVYLVPLLYLILGALVYVDIASASLFLPLYLITFFVSGGAGKKVSTILSTFDSKAQVLETYSKLFSIVEKEQFDSTLLRELQSLLKSKKSASQSVIKLKSLHTNLLMAETYPILLFINPVLLWNVKYGIKVERWIDEHKDEISKWFDVIAEFDALVSWAVYAFNHPDYAYPKPSESFCFVGEELGHPMLNRNTCVKNDINLSKSPYFLVVTGANMAGKSTYLRTIGINHTLACAGAPVCAKSLIFYPGNLVTNLRTADSLADNESYFFAELKRLKMIIDRLQSGEELFIILDEILKGTNSIDKQKGSLALMKQLVSLNGNGIIATHDLVLGSLEKEYPESIKNYRFEADITNDHLSFTYKIREGIAQNMNASFLMKQMGITGL